MFGVSKPICPEASLTHDGTRLLHQRSKRSGKQRVSRKAAAPWSRGCCRSGVFALDILSSRYSIGLPGGGAYAPHKCFAASKTLRRGNLFTPSIQIPRTGGRLRRPEPKKKDMTCWSCLSFWVSPPRGRLHPSAIQILGGSEFRLRRGFACGKTLVRRKGAAGQKAGWVVLLYLFEISKYRF